MRSDRINCCADGQCDTVGNQRAIYLIALTVAFTGCSVFARDLEKKIHESFQSFQIKKKLKDMQPENVQVNCHNHVISFYVLCF